MISLEVAPYFYTLSENYRLAGRRVPDPYREGRLPQPTKQIYETLLDNGTLNTIDLRRLAQIGKCQRFGVQQGVGAILQADFKILPIGVAKSGAWNYAFIYEITARYWPDLVEGARYIGEAEARTKLLRLVFPVCGCGGDAGCEQIIPLGKCVD